MNLIEDAWIPVRLSDGSVERIAPWQITSKRDQENIIELAASRPDFNGALVQLLIGMLQTTCAPENNRKWRQWLCEPPAPEELYEKFAAVKPAFDLDGVGARFMQENQPGQEKANCKIAALLIDAPGENAISRNTDHFIKRDGVKRACLPCASMALITLQMNAPSGGRGHRTGLRGGGPLSSIVLGGSLWETCWNNVLNRGDFLALADKAKEKESYRFPWLGPVTTSEKNQIVTMEDVHPDQIFWSMPRRISLDILNQKGRCDICGSESENGVEQFWTKAYGINYGDSGNWRHPLTPYSVNKKQQQATAVHPQAEGIAYRHWLGLVQSYADAQNERLPAEVITQFRSRKHSGEIRIWAFGYDMDNMKARRWCDSTMPLYLIDDSLRQSFEYQVANIIQTAQAVLFVLRQAVKAALFNHPGEVRGDLSFIDARFWQETEPDFFTTVRGLRKALDGGEEVQDYLKSWHRVLTKEAGLVFDDLSQSGSFEAAEPRRVALAWNQLRRSLRSKKMFERLGLNPD